MAVTQHSVRIIKTFPYRDDPVKEFSNRYYFDGGAPADSDAWHLLMDAVVANESTIYHNQCHLVKALGYAPGSDIAVASKEYTTAGVLAVGTGTGVPGDCAAVLRMATTKRSTRFHTVYVFSYYHCIMSNNATTSSDDLYTAQRTAIGAYADAWQTGITVGGRTYKRTTPDGHLTTGHDVLRYVGHRDFPR